GIANRNQARRLAVPPDHDTSSERFVGERRITALASSSSEMSVRYIQLQALLRREAVPIFLHLRRGHPTRHQAVYANLFLLLQPPQHGRQSDDTGLCHVITRRFRMLPAMPDRGG